MPAIDLSNGLVLFCGAALALVSALSLISFASIFVASSGDRIAERSAAFLISVFAAAISLFAFWTAAFSSDWLPMSLVRLSGVVLQVVAPFGLSAALFQVQAAFAAVLIALLAFRFPGRGD